MSVYEEQAQAHLTPPLHNGKSTYVRVSLCVLSYQSTQVIQYNAELMLEGWT